MRCAHQNVQVVEEYITATLHDVLFGEVTHTNDPVNGQYSGFVEVVCWDCKMVHPRFNRLKMSARGAARIPRWVQRALNQSGIPIQVVKP